MIDTSPSPVDGKWYTHTEAVERQEQLIETMPTGTNWYWVNGNGSAVVFSGKSKANLQEHKPNRAERRKIKGKTE
jgi:hypothetical protein